MGVSYNAYAGFGLRFDRNLLEAREITNASCKCSDRGKGLFCSQCGKKISESQVLDCDQVFEELQNYLEDNLPDGFQMISDESLEYCYLGWFLSVCDWKITENSIEASDFPPSEEVFETIKNLIGEHYSEIVDEEQFGFHIFMQVG